jgi:hypothetical protein
VDLLGLVPDLLLDVAGHIGIKPHFYMYRFPLIHTEAQSHEIFQIEIFGDRKGFLCLVEHFDPVQSEYPDLVSHVAETDQVKGPIEEPYPVGVHLSPGLFLPAHGVIDDLDGFPVEGRLGHPVENLLEPAVIFSWLHTKMKGLLHVLETLVGNNNNGRNTSMNYLVPGAKSISVNANVGFSKIDLGRDLGDVQKAPVKTGMK